MVIGDDLRVMVSMVGGMAPRTVYTVGHSTRSAEEFVALLHEFGVQQLVDIRTVPRSRTNPQFNLDQLPATLADAGIGHTYCKGLGGLRPTSKDSINTAWRNASFRGYADYMQTGEFRAALAALEDLAADRTVAIMCAEAVWWRCHRSLVAEALLVRGWDVQHIMGPGKLNPATLRDFAVVDGDRITYPGGTDAAPERDRDAAPERGPAQRPRPQRRTAAAPEGAAPDAHRPQGGG